MDIRGLLGRKIRTKLGRQIRTMREERRWTQSKLGTLCGIGKAQISKIENGDLSQPELRLLRIAEIFGHELWFVEGAGDSRMPLPFFYRAVIDLNEQIMNNIRHNPIPDIVVGLNHGGAIVGGLLYYLNRQRFHFTVFWVGVDSSLRPRPQRHKDFKSELTDLVAQLGAQGNRQPLILLVDDTLRTGKVMSVALPVVKEVAPNAIIKIGVILYRPDLAELYDPTEMADQIYAPDRGRFHISSYDKIFYE